MEDGCVQVTAVIIQGVDTQEDRISLNPIFTWASRLFGLDSVFVLVKRHPEYDLPSCEASKIAPTLGVTCCG